MKDIKKSIDLIEHLIQIDEWALNKQFKNSHEKILFERGYLTGLLASIISEDFYAENMINTKIKEIETKYFLK